MADDLVVRAALKDELSGPLGDIRSELRELNKAADQTTRSADNAGGGLARMARGAGGLAKMLAGGVVRTVKATVIGLGALAVAVATAGVKFTGLAMDAAETASAFNTVFGAAAKNVQSYLTDLSTRFGITTAELQNAATQFGVFGKAAGVPKKELASFSKDLVQAGLDLSSFYNADPNEVFMALKSGLAGEAEPLRTFGIFLSDATMQAEAKTMGLGKTLTESQKVMVRQRLILKSLGDANGDLARTSGGLANQWRGLQGRLKEGATVIGGLLLPVALKLVSAVNGKLSPAIANLRKQAPNLTAAFKDKDWQGVGEVIDNIAGNTGKLVTPIRVLLNALSQVPNLFGAIKDMDTQGIAEVVDNMLGNTGAKVEPIRTALDGLRTKWGELSAVVTGSVIPALQSTAGVLDVAGAALSWGATHTDALKVALIALLSIMGAVKVVHVGMAVAAGISTAATRVSSAATWLNTTAKTVNNSTAMTWLGVKALEFGAWLRSTVATGANTVTTGANTAVKQVANAFLLTFLVTKALEFGAWVRSTVATGAATVAMWAHVAAGLAARGATVAWTAVQWLLNAALTANPIGAIIVLVIAIAAALVLAYRKSSTFRAIVDGMWAALKTAGVWFGNLIVTVGKFLLKWTPLGQAITLVKDNWDSILGVLQKVAGAFGKVGEAASKAKDWAGGALSKVGIGDTHTPRHGGGRAGGALAGHARVNAALGGGYHVSNLLTGGGGHGRGSGDHQSGRAVDVVGRGMRSYAAEVRRQGGYAAIHGQGSGRHVHAVMGDTNTTRARGAGRGTAATSGGTQVIVSPGAIVVYADSELDIESAIAAGLEKFIRDAEERS